MGYKPRKDKRKTGTIMPVHILEKLMTGHVFFADEPSEAELADAWDENKSYIMDCIGQPMRDIEPDFFNVGATGVPIPWGCRPFGWWRYESVEPRRLLSGDPALADPSKGLWFGTPNHYVSAEAHRSMVYESQAAYLQRLGLLLPGEAERIGP